MPESENCSKDFVTPAASALGNDGKQGMEKKSGFRIRIASTKDWNWSDTKSKNPNQTLVASGGMVRKPALKRAVKKHSGKTTLNDQTVKRKPRADKALLRKAKKVQNFLDKYSTDTSPALFSDDPNVPGRIIVPWSRFAGALACMRTDYKMDISTDSLAESVASVFLPITSTNGNGVQSISHYSVDIRNKSELEKKIHAKLEGYGLEHVMILATEMEMYKTFWEEAVTAQNLLDAAEQGRGGEV